LLTFRGVTLFSGPPPVPSTTLSLAPTDGSQIQPRCSSVQIIRSNLGVVSDGAGDYSPDTACSWNFDRSLGRTVSISFTSFDIESGYDFVKIFDGDLLVQSFTGSSVPPSFRRTLSDSLSIRFSSDSSVQASGFIAQYTLSAEVQFTLIRLLRSSHPHLLRLTLDGLDGIRFAGNYIDANSTCRGRLIVDER
jgi:hypothetical protein